MGLKSLIKLEFGNVIIFLLREESCREPSEVLRAGQDLAHTVNGIHSVKIINFT